MSGGELVTAHDASGNARRANQRHDESQCSLFGAHSRAPLSVCIPAHDNPDEKGTTMPTTDKQQKHDNDQPDFIDIGGDPDFTWVCDGVWDVWSLRDNKRVYTPSK